MSSNPSVPPSLTDTPTLPNPHKSTNPYENSSQTSPSESRRVSVARLRTTESTANDTEISKYLNQLRFPHSDYVKLAKQFSQHLADGVNGISSCLTSLKPSKTLVRKIQVEQLEEECSECLYVDFGGTFFRIGYSSYVVQDGRSMLHTESQVSPLPSSINSSTIEHIFQLIAQKIGTFTKNMILPNSNNKYLPVAFVCSFPCDVGDSIKSAFIRRFTKAMNIEHTTIDAGEYLQNELDKLKLGVDDFKFKVSVVMNDTTATLLSYKNTNIYDMHQNVNDVDSCEASLILGLGCNMAYFDTDIGQVVCTEMGGYGEKGELDSIQIPFDKIIIFEQSMHKGEQAMEKMGVSDIYMGELVRLIMVDLIKKGMIFSGGEFDGISEPFCLKGSQFVTQVLSASEWGLMNQVQDILVKYELFGTFSDCEAVVAICTAVSKRAAKIVAMFVAGVVLRLTPTRSLLTIACDGGLYRKHPCLARWIEKFANEFLEELKIHMRIKLANSTLSSGPGAVACTLGKLYL